MMRRKHPYRVNHLIARVQVRAASSDSPFRTIGKMAGIPRPPRIRGLGYIDPGNCEVKMRDVGAIVRDAWYSGQLCEMRVVTKYMIIRISGYFTEIAQSLPGNAVATFTLADFATSHPPHRRLSRYRRWG
jgi:hypothetical protein